MHTLKLVSILGCVLGSASCSTLPDAPSENSDPVTITSQDPHILYSGRIKQDDQGVLLNWSGSRIRLRFSGKSIAMLIEDDSAQKYVQVFLDGEAAEKIHINSEDKLYKLAADLDNGPHTVEIVKATEANLGSLHFEGFVLDASGESLPHPAHSGRSIEFIGDSITCGYGVETNDPNIPFSPETENFCLGYSGLSARQLNADYLVVSRSGIGMVREYDGPYEGSEERMPTIYPYTHYHDEEQAWNFGKFTPDVICINLGTNDFSTSSVDIEKYISEYTQFAKELLQHYPKAQLVMIQGPMENGQKLQDALSRVVEQVNTDHPGQAHYLKLSAQGAHGFGADWHPNEAQSRINADELTAYLSHLMDWQ